VREVTRVATLQTEPDWLELARRLDMRSLERRVATEREATGTKSDGRGERRVDEPARTEWIGSETVRVTFELPIEAWTLLERAMREARRAGAAGFGDASALEAVARAALSVQTRPADASDADCRVVAREWPNSGDSEPDAGAGPAALGLSTAAARGRGTSTRSATASGLATEATQGGSAAERGPGRTRGATALELDQSGIAVRGCGVATRGATGLEVGPNRARGVSLGDPTDRRTDDERVRIVSVEQALPCEPAVRLIHLMGHCGGWTLDALTEASGLSVQEVSIALTLLELGGRVQRRAFAFHPV
jgi:hypothetical protein